MILFCFPFGGPWVIAQPYNEEKGACNNLTDGHAQIEVMFIVYVNYNIVRYCFLLFGGWVQWFVAPWLPLKDQWFLNCCVYGQVAPKSRSEGRRYIQYGGIYCAVEEFGFICCIKLISTHWLCEWWYQCCLSSVLESVQELILNVFMSEEC